MFSIDPLRLQVMKPKSKKDASIRLFNGKDSTRTSGLYQIEVGAKEQALLMINTSDRHWFHVVCSDANLNTDALMDAVSQKANAKAEVIPEGKVIATVKNTFLDVTTPAGQAADEELVGKLLPRSFSDSDLMRLQAELQTEDDGIHSIQKGVPIPGMGFFTDDMISVSGSQGSRGRRSGMTTSTATSKLVSSQASSPSRGSVEEVRIGTGYVIDATSRRGMPTPTRTITFGEFQQLAVNEEGVRLTAASANHQPGRRSRCRKCAFYNILNGKKDKSCKNGALCDFCHEPHYDRFIHRM
jgi:hypothetical protein